MARLLVVSVAASTLVAAAVLSARTAATSPRSSVAKLCACRHASDWAAPAGTQLFVRAAVRGVGPRARLRAAAGAHWPLRGLGRAVADAHA